MSVFKSIFNTLGFGKPQMSQGDDAKEIAEEVNSVEGSLFTDFLEKDSALNSSFGSDKGGIDTYSSPSKTIKQQIKSEIEALEYPEVNCRFHSARTFCGTSLRSTQRNATTGAR